MSELKVYVMVRSNKARKAGQGSLGLKARGRLADTSVNRLVVQGTHSYGKAKSAFNSSKAHPDLEASLGQMSPVNEALHVKAHLLPAISCLYCNNDGGYLLKSGCTFEYCGDTCCAWERKERLSTPTLFRNEGI